MRKLRCDTFNALVMLAVLEGSFQSAPTSWKRKTASGETFRCIRHERSVQTEIIRPAICNYFTLSRFALSLAPFMQKKPKIDDEEANN